MFIFFLVIVAIIPIIMIVVALIWKKNPPKQINSAYGYRTTRSLKSQETWDFAHKYMGKLLLYIGLIQFIPSLIPIIILRNEDNNILGISMIIIIATQIALLWIPIIPTEMALKKRFESSEG